MVLASHNANLNRKGVMAGLLASTSAWGLAQWLSPPVVVAYVLVLVRVSGLMTTAPWFQQQAIPNRSKAGLAMVLSALLLLGHVELTALPSLAALHSLPLLAAAAVQELVIGLVLGLAAHWVMLAFQAAGELVSVQMGLSMATALDPSSGGVTPITGKVLALLAVLLFFAYDVHHALLNALALSFSHIPLAQPWLLGHTGLLAQLLASWLMALFVLGLTLALPVMGLLLLVEVAMGFLAKLVPQMNIFMVGLPIKVMLGLWMMAESLPFCTEVFTKALVALTEALQRGLPLN
jgi:flagellar biosynthesis protein FliR